MESYWLGNDSDMYGVSMHVCGEFVLITFIVYPRDFLVYGPHTKQSSSSLHYFQVEMIGFTFTHNLKVCVLHLFCIRMCKVQQAFLIKKVSYIASH